MSCSITCAICGENDNGAIPCKWCLTQCCQLCLTEHVLTRIKNKEMPVVCPGANCLGVISHKTAEAVLASLPDELENYCKLRTLKDNPNARLCPGCRHVVTTGSAKSPNLTCENCNLLFCFHHETAHANRRCPGLRTNIGWRNVLWQWIYTKKCPACKTRIEKNGGCSKMKCSKCGHYFCWTCLGSAGGGGHVSEIFPAMHDLKQACSTPRIWALRVLVGVVVGIPAACIILVISPIVLFVVACRSNI